MAKVPDKFENVTVLTKANLYFDGKVISHSVLFADGTKKTLGLIYPGKFHFGTNLAERMEIVAGECRVVVGSKPAVYAAGQVFEVAAQSGFDIEVTQGVCEYICSYIP
jgi:purine/pyrimidine-nucleoside phosphorylase